jgi:hypothetical protein
MCAVYYLFILPVVISVQFIISATTTTLKLVAAAYKNPFMSLLHHDALKIHYY